MSEIKFGSAEPLTEQWAIVVPPLRLQAIFVLLPCMEAIFVLLHKQYSRLSPACNQYWRSSPARKQYRCVPPPLCLPNNCCRSLPLISNWFAVKFHCHLLPRENLKTKFYCYLLPRVNLTRGKLAPVFVEKFVSRVVEIRNTTRALSGEFW